MVPDMLQRRPFLVLVFALAALAIVGGLTPAWAHTDPAARPAVEALERALPVDDVALPGFVLTAAPDVPGLPWPALVGGLMVATLGWRRPRRAAALALVLLLAVF